MLGFIEFCWDGIKSFFKDPLGMLFPKLRKRSPKYQRRVKGMVIMAIIITVIEILIKVFIN